MKKFGCFLLTFVLLASCNKDNFKTDGILIKGKISNSNSLKTSDSPKGEYSKSSSSLTLADAKKVLMFHGSKYSLTDIIDGSFTAYAEMGSTTALVFLSADNKYIGNLSASGLNVLPLISLKDGDNTIIDLSTLTLDGNMVIPAHNPLGDEINITAEEIDLFKMVGGYYESLAKNIDADNDGIPDILNDKQITISSLFSTVGGKWGTNDTKASVTDPSQFFINYMILLNGGKSLTFSNGNISFSGPEGDPYNDISLHGFRLTPDGPQGFLASFKREFYPPAPGTPEWNVLKPFKKGAYTLTLDGNRFYTLNYSNINCKYYMILVIPTLHTNSEGKLVSISLEYKLPDNVTTVDPANILTELMVQLNNPEMFYNSPWLSIKTGFTIINLSTPLDISSLHHMSIGYFDSLGNEYNIIWEKFTGESEEVRN